MGGVSTIRPGLNSPCGSKVRFTLLKRLERERRVILGPALRSAERVREEILRLPAVKQRIAEVAKIQKKPVDALEKRAKRTVMEIEARMNHSVLVIMARFFDETSR